jgi:lipoprotein-anchoring transpeptidase ErfK/SrfK
MKLFAIAVALGASLLAVPANAGSVVARIDISAQRMDVFVDGWRQYTWPVSTARPGYRTPTGAFRAQRLEKTWFSRKYDNSPMPNSVFFYGGFAIHGTNYVSRLGTPASHGCVRLHPANAATLFSLVRANGMASTEIIVSN